MLGEFLACQLLLRILPEKGLYPVAAFSAEDTLPVHAEITDDELSEISTILSMWRNINMSAYKDKCMKRRVAIRMRSTRCRDAAEYCNLLRQSPQELDLLQKALTIHVSQFFRNPSMFDKLRDDVLPGPLPFLREKRRRAAALLVPGLRRRRRTLQPGNSSAGTFQQGNAQGPDDHSRHRHRRGDHSDRTAGRIHRQSASRRSRQVSRTVISGRTEHVFAWYRNCARW